MGLNEMAKIEPADMREKREKEFKEYSSAMKDYPTAILTSMARANRDYLDRTFAFSTPQGDPKNIDSFRMVDYFQKLNSYALKGSQPGWFTSGLTSSIISAGSLSTANNLLTTIGATNTYFTRDILNIAPYTYEAKSARRGETYQERTRK